MARGYSAKLVRQKVLKARKVSCNELLDKVKMKKGFRLTLNITYHQAFSKLAHILNSLNKPQESFYAHFKEQSNKGMDDW